MDSPSGENRWQAELDDLAYRRSLPATGKDGPEPQIGSAYGYTYESRMTLDEAHRILKEWIREHSPPCHGVTPIWKDDEDANGGWSNVVKAYEDWE